MNHRHHIPSVLLVLVMACLAFSSCALSRRPPVAPSEEVCWEGRTPRDVLAALRAEKDKIKSLTAAFSLSVDPPPKGQPANMQGVIFFSSEDSGLRIRIKCLGIFGRPIFDMLLRDNEVQLYIPSRRTMYTGRIDPTAGANVWGDVMAAMLLDVSEASLPEDAALFFEEDMVLVPLKDAELRLDRTTGLIRQWHQADTITLYERYTAHNSGLPPLPERIEVLAVDGSQRAVFRLSQPSFNSVQASVFNLDEYTPEVVRDFSELEKQKP